MLFTDVSKPNKCDYKNYLRGSFTFAAFYIGIKKFFDMIHSSSGDAFPKFL